MLSDGTKFSRRHHYDHGEESACGAVSVVGRSQRLPVMDAARYLGKLRGGSQAKLIEVEDGSAYVVKFRNNAQHRRVLINEMVGSMLLRYLHLPVPSSALVAVSRDVVRQYQEMYIERGHIREPCSTGLQYGSRHPYSDTGRAVYDYVPTALVSQVRNVESYLGALAFDKWIGNADGRQSVVFRIRVGAALKSGYLAGAQAASLHPLRLVYVVAFIDHGLSLNGEHWDFLDCPSVGLSHSPAARHAYQRVTGVGSFEPWLSRIEEIPKTLLDRAVDDIPAEWFEDDRERLRKVLSQLYSRRSVVPDLICNLRDEEPSVFPNWRSDG